MAQCKTNVFECPYMKLSRCSLDSLIEEDAFHFCFPCLLSFKKHPPHYTGEKTGKSSASNSKYF